MKNNIIELIARHISGESSPDEEKRLNAWLDASEENRKSFDEYRSVWENMERVRSVAGVDIEQEWNHQNSLIREAEAGNTRKLDLNGRTETERKPAARSTVFMFTRMAAAAVVVFALVSGGIFLSRNLGSVSMATDGMPGRVTLPDGSAVTLNSHSILVYPKKFKKDTRQVSLEGEAFFEVNGNPDRPFVIQAHDLDIRVLGTRFNVNAYESNDQIEVIVESGQVAVTRQGEIPETLILKPGNKALYLKSEEDLSLSRSIDRNYLAWKTRNFYFEDQRLADVAEVLNRVYGTNILIPSDSLKNVRITSNFINEQPESILSVLAATLDLELVELDGRTLLKESK